MIEDTNSEKTKQWDWADPATHGILLPILVDLALLATCFGLLCLLTATL